MRTTTKSMSFGFVGYLILLLGFVCMGVFIMTLAGGFDAPAWPSGVAMVAFFTVSIAAFRHQIGLSAKSRLAGDVLVSSDPLTPPLHRADVERYRRTYRRHLQAESVEPADEGTRLHRAA